MKTFLAALLISALSIVVGCADSAYPNTQELVGRFVDCQTTDGAFDQDYNSYIDFYYGFEGARVAVGGVQSTSFIVSDTDDVVLTPGDEWLISGYWNLINDEPTETYDFVLHNHPHPVNGVVMDGMVEIKTNTFDEICDVFYRGR